MEFQLQAKRLNFMLVYVLLFLEACHARIVVSQRFSNPARYLLSSSSNCCRTFTIRYNQNQDTTDTAEHGVNEFYAAGSVTITYFKRFLRETDDTIPSPLAYTEYTINLKNFASLRNNKKNPLEISDKLIIAETASRIFMKSSPTSDEISNCIWALGTLRCSLDHWKQKNNSKNNAHGRSENIG